VDDPRTGGAQGLDAGRGAALEADLGEERAVGPAQEAARSLHGDVESPRLTGLRGVLERRAGELREARRECPGLLREGRRSREPA
jgi:hypothetical protein